MKALWKTYLIKFSLVALLALLLFAGSLFLKPSEAQAGACYGGAVNSAFIEAGTKFPEDPANYYYTQVYKTTSRCRDINFRFTNNAGYHELLYVRVCFYPSRGGHYCQNNFQVINTNDYTWHVIATNVLDGTRFHVQGKSYWPPSHLKSFRFQLAF